MTLKTKTLASVMFENPEETMAVFESLEMERKAEEDSYRNPEVALQSLSRSVQQMNSYILTYGSEDNKPLPLPTKVLEVLDVRVTGTFRENRFFLRARAVREDDVEDIIELGAWHSYGSEIEPPDSDLNVLWEGLDNEGNPIEWEHLYTITNPWSKCPDHERIARQKKVEYLLAVLKRDGVRARIHESQLQYNTKQEEEVYSVLGRHLLHLKPTDSLWDREP